ncbi:MAG: hypothetical protein WB706_09195 [Nitrososphaeraceae archaeon]
MTEISRTYCHPKDVDVSISQISDGIYRIAGFVKEFGITFNQFLIEDDNPTLIRTYWYVSQNRREGKGSH